VPKDVVKIIQCAAFFTACRFCELLVVELSVLSTVQYCTWSC